MKRLPIIVAFVFFVHAGKSQQVIIKGRVRCLNQVENVTKGAENIVVVPTFAPSKSSVTASRPSGYFELNTGIPISTLQDKLVNLYVVSRCSHCKEIVRRVFISEDQDRLNRSDQKKYVTVRDWKLNANCKQAELNPRSADSLLQLIVNRPQEKLGDISGASAVAGAPAFLNFLTNLTTVAGILNNQGDFILDSLGPGKISYGNFLWSSPLNLSANTGFNFSPTRDMSEAVFWNPSAIVNSKKLHSISLLSNLKNNAKLAGFVRLTEKLSLGLGGIYTRQDERRFALFRKPTIFSVELKSDSTIMKLQEYAAVISPSLLVSNKLSIGASFKSIWQKFNTPDFLDVSREGVGTFKDSSIKEQHFDVDLSLSYKISGAFQVGLNFMNLAGTELHADAFVPRRRNVSLQNLRSLGIGLVYKYKRWNFGADILLTEDGLYDAAIGVNFVPFNNGLISAGFAVKQMSYSASFRLKNFRIAYIDDNRMMVNEKRQGKSAILNGRIYGGFIFDFD
ncbi:hypothetical protein EXU57_15700 [Segetibacter sp. 3557_3]|uniref:hypothetical protein n=1 Tax=Segetibacter sp. 3557_3 TaxID=2547429 RepID=UPI001058A027|nr:hypothetical protein [Segetibacter sp. 3557_3]TDH24255.1 hypothetical protein EXU57_15700 [Segetibacter sp. 3557_3]